MSTSFRVLRLAATVLCTFACACSAGLAAENSARTQRSTISVGATLPLTGPDSKSGTAFKEGYDLAFEEANAAGGIELSSGRRKVELTLLDDRGQVEAAAMLADRLISQEKVDFLLGTYQSNTTKAQSIVAEQQGVPYVSGGGAVASIYAGSKWTFGLLAPVDMLAYSEMRWIDVQQNSGKLPPHLRIAILWENTAHGKDFRAGVTDFATKTARRRVSYEIVFDEPFELEGSDAKGIMARLREARADVFLADAHLADFIALHKEYVAAKLCHQVVSYGARGAEAQAAAAIGRDNVQGILSAVWWHNAIGGQELNRLFGASFEKRYHRKPEWYSALGYESARALFAAISAARSIDREKVREQLASLKMESILPGGRLSFLNRQAHYPFVVQQNRADGSSPIIYPVEVAQSPGEVNTHCGGAKLVAGKP
jgi:branched-chain amino acid transport system substrate-binding protein